LVPSYQIPTAGFAKDSRLGREILGGWTIEGTFNARSGYPLNVAIGRDVIGNGRAQGQRPDAVPGVDPNVSGGSDPLVWFTRNAFDITGPSTQHRFGNLGWNTLRGPSAFWSDMGLRKEFIIAERHRFEFRLEAFNWLNHVVFAQPNTNLSSAIFGRVTAGSDGRNFQFALKYFF